MQFDQEIARQIIGKYILIGISYIDSTGAVESQQQLHGTVERSSEEEGIIVELQGVYAGEKIQLPSDTTNISVAQPGVYALTNTKETIENPDFLCAFEVYKAAENPTT